MPKTIKTLFILTLLQLYSNCCAQTSIKSKLTDTDNNPVTFANIYIPESKKTTLSNESGDFYMVINPETDKTIIISHLSYQPIEVKITNSFPKNIVLEEGSLQLNEVVIGKQITGYDIALKVVENLKNNHDVDPAYYEYFTRVVQYDNDWKEIDLIQEYYGKLKHNGEHNTKALVYKSRIVPYTKKGEEILQTDSSIDLWGIRSDNLLLYKPDYLKKAKLKSYSISIEGSIIINGHDCYVLKYINDKADYFGRFVKAYIDKKSYGIVKVIGKSYSQNENYIERNFININKKWVLATVTYKHHLHKIITTLYTYLRDKEDYINIKFKKTPFYKNLEKLNKNPNDTFWDNYQHIPLPENQAINQH